MENSSANLLQTLLRNLKTNINSNKTTFLIATGAILIGIGLY